MTLLESLQTQLAAGLMRKSATTCSKWAETYVVYPKPIPGPLRFERHPWSRTWHDYESNWAGMKAAQLAMTAAALNRALYNIDVLKNDVLYLLPKKNPDAVDFSKTKFDAILDQSPHIESLFSNTRNVGLKQAGSVSFYLRGMRSKSGLKLISVGMQVYDEYDEMPLRNIALADERSSGYEEGDKQVIKISTPTVPEFGIAEEIEKTTKEHYIFKCPNCSQWTEFLPESLIVVGDNVNDERTLKRSHLVTVDCKHVVNHAEKPTFLSMDRKRAMWKPTAESDYRGFLINQMYSTVLPPWKIAKTAILARTDSGHEQELWNSKFGLPFVVQGARITDQMLLACRGDHQLTDPPRPGLVTMGVDVGHKVLYVHIDRWLMPPSFGSDLNAHAVPQPLWVGIVSGFDQLDPKLYEYQVAHTVVDVDPAFRDALDFARRHDGRVNLCRFVRSVGPKNIAPGSREADVVIYVNRTYWLDISQGRYRRAKKGIILPRDLPDDYAKHIKNIIRHEKKDDEGNLVAKYISVGADHYAFSRVYSELALPMAVSVSEGRDVKDFL